MSSVPYDVALKDLLENYLADLLPLAGVTRICPVEVIDADVSTVSAAADKVLRVLDDPPWLLHLEMQSSFEADLDERLHWYNALLRHRHGQRVRTVLVLLRRAADAPRLTGVYRDLFPNEDPYLEFHYRVVRVWEMPVEKLLTGGLGMLPLAPLGDVTEAVLPSVIKQMQERVSREAAPNQASTLWTTTFILMGLRYSQELSAQLLRGVRAMKESVTYQAILDEGKIEEAKAILLRQGSKRFGLPKPEVKAAFDAITDLDRLERMSDRLLEVASWDELLTTP